MAYCADGALRGAALPDIGTLLRLCALPALAGALLLAACDAGPQPVTERDGATALTVIDDTGREIRLPRPARRVISMIPAQTEIVGMLAGRDVLIARTQWDTDPALAHLPSVGNALTPSVEWLAAQQPDLIIAWPDAQSRDVVQRLTDIGVPVYSSRVESLADIRGAIRRLGVLLGAEARADSLIQTVDAELAEVRAATAHLPERTVLYLLNTDPPMAAGPGTFVDDVLRVAGGRNIFADAGQLWPHVSLEEIVRHQPDVIIRPSERSLTDPLIGIRGRPGWRDLRAVQTGDVYAVDPDLFNRAGVTVAEVARRIARQLHGVVIE